MTAAPRFFALRISIYYAAAFVIGGLVTPFLPVWLQMKGFGPEQIALCLAIPLAARILFMPVGSWFADHAPNRRFAILVFATLALALFLPAAFSSLHLVVLAFTALAITVSGLAMPATDALALTGVRRFGLDYGGMRVWGSISFVVVSLAGGAVFGHFGTATLTPMLIGSFVIAASFALALPVTPRAVRAADDAVRPAQRSAWSVLASPVFLVVVASSSLVQASHGMFYSFGSIHWGELGFSGGEIGLLWAVGVVTEIAIFGLVGRMPRLKAETLILIGALATVLRWALFPIITDLWLSLALQALHGLTFAASFTGMQLAIARSVPEEMTASAQGICQIVSGLLMAATTLASGPLYARFGVDAMWVMTGFGALAALVLVLGSRLPQPQRPGSGGLTRLP